MASFLAWLMLGLILTPIVLGLLFILDRYKEWLDHDLH